MCQQTTGSEFSYYWKQPVISRERRGRQHIIRLLSAAISRNQASTVSPRRVLINAHQATTGCPDDGELLIRQPLIIYETNNSCAAAQLRR